MKRHSIVALLLFLSLPSVWAGDPMQKLAKEFGRSMSSLKNPRVGILSFPYHDGKMSSGSSILSERLTTYMADVKNIRIIERTLLKKVLEEQHLAETGVVDASSAQRVGKILNVDVLVTGTLNDVNDRQTELNARILRSDTGEVIAARHTVVERIWTDSPRRPRLRNMDSSTNSMDDDTPHTAPNEAIEIGFPGGRGGRSYGGK